MSKYTFVAIVALAVLAGDQLSKWHVRQTLEVFERVPIIESFFHLTHVQNPGGAFSLLANTSDAVRISLFLIASLIAVAVLCYFLYQAASHQRWLQFALAGVLGGALGNLIDRVWAGQVTDFLDFHVGGYHWPAFNVADSFITVGVAILLFQSISRPGPPEGS